MSIKKMLRKLHYRTWSNDEIGTVLGRITNYNRVINVSGWKDDDKEGRKYQSYFKRDLEKYDISNYTSDNAKGLSSPNDIELDISGYLPSELIEHYDFVFNHTVLEHVENPVFAFQQISKLTSDLLLTVVPWKQELHFIPNSFGDYYRFSPMIMRKLYQDNGFTVLYESFSPNYSPVTYLIYLGSKKPFNHINFPIMLPDINTLNNIVGRSNFKDTLQGMLLRVIYFFYKKF